MLRLLLLLCVMRGWSLDIPKRRVRSQDMGAENMLRHTTFIQYNIKDGGGDWDGGGDRYEYIIRWLKVQEADVVGLCELNGWENYPGMASRARSAGYNYSYLLEEESGYNLGILSRRPFVMMEGTGEGFERGMLHVRMTIDDLVWHVFVVHLNAHDAFARLEESRIVAKKIKKLDNRGPRDVVVVMGDFNTLSPYDAKEYEHEHLLNYLIDGSKESKLLKKLVVRNEIFYAPLNILMSQAGLADPCVESWNRCGPTEPTGMSLDQASAEDWQSNPQMRLDYILVDSATVQFSYAIKCEVLRNPELDRLSDHYPIRCLFAPSSSSRVVLPAMGGLQGGSE